MGHKIKIGLLLFFGVWGGLFSALTVADDTVWRSSADDGVHVHLYFFWSPTCPHCQKARQYIEPLAARTPWLELHSFNIVNVRENAQRYQTMAESLGESARYVPAFFVCGDMFSGWDSPEGTGRALLNAARTCRIGMSPKTGNFPGAAIKQESSPAVDVPLLGKVDSSDYSLPLFTLIIAGMDAFNPCAFFVLLFLLSLLVHARSRLRMAVIGGCFVVVSGAVYFVFMSAWLNLFFWLGEISWITLAAGGVAVVIGLLGIKDFVFALKGPSLSISDNAKPKLYGRMRGLISSDSLPTMLIGTVVLATAANSYELLCTAGFPMVYTRTLTLHHFDSTTYYLYLLLYNLIYVVPLMFIVALFTATLGARKLSLTEGRLLKLLSGLMMLGLGVILLLDPGLLNQFATGLGVLLFALLATFVAWVWMRGRV